MEVEYYEQRSRLQVQTQLGSLIILGESELAIVG